MMRLITSLIATMALIGFACLLSLVSGLLLGYWRKECQEAKEQPVTPSCDNCRYGDCEWEDPPCVGCSDVNNRWEEKGDQND